MSVGQTSELPEFVEFQMGLTERLASPNPIIYSIVPPEKKKTFQVSAILGQTQKSKCDHLLKHATDTSTTA